MSVMNDDDEFTVEQRAMFEADADEAERGYSVEFLRTRRMVRAGRPLELGDEAGKMVRFRMTPSMLRKADDRAARLHLNRSEYLRKLVDDDIADNNVGELAPA